MDSPRLSVATVMYPPKLCCECHKNMTNGISPICNKCFWKSFFEEADELETEVMFG